MVEMIAIGGIIFSGLAIYVLARGLVEQDLDDINAKQELEMLDIRRKEELKRNNH